MISKFFISNIPKRAIITTTTTNYSNRISNSKYNNKCSCSSIDFQQLLTNLLQKQSSSFGNIQHGINSLHYIGIVPLFQQEKNKRIKALKTFGILGRNINDENDNDHCCYNYRKHY
jgi:hypothetical protein